MKRGCLPLSLVDECKLETEALSARPIADSNATSSTLTHLVRFYGEKKRAPISYDGQLDTLRREGDDGVYIPALLFVFGTMRIASKGFSNGVQLSFGERNAPPFVTASSSFHRHVDSARVTVMDE